MKIEIRNSEDGQFYCVIVGGNGEDWYTSETYPEKPHASDSAEGLVAAFKKKFEAGVVVQIVDTTSG